MRGVGLALFLALAACVPEEEPEARALLELERLSFVPPATCTLLPGMDLSVPRALVIDRYEFTRGDLLHYWPERQQRGAALEWHDDAARSAPERSDWPAFVDFQEARDLAAARGMRLPTPVEWLHVALGRRDYAKPWGGPGREYFANTIVIQDGRDYSLNAPVAVGTFENGKSRPFGCYDLLGNVWEWVDGVVAPCVPDPLARGDGHDDQDGTRASLLGGGYDSAWRPTYELDRNTNRLRFHARTEDKRNLSPAFGVRMCAEAGPYLSASAARWGHGARVAERVAAVGKRWAEEDALARAALGDLLRELRASPGSAEGLGWLAAGLELGP